MDFRNLAKVGSVIIARDKWFRRTFYTVTDVPENDKGLVRVSKGGAGRWMRRKDILVVFIA